MKLHAGKLSQPRQRPLPIGHIDAGVEIVPIREFAEEMSTGVSYFEQFVWDLEQSGVADIDILVFNSRFMRLAGERAPHRFFQAVLTHLHIRRIVLFGNSD